MVIERFHNRDPRPVYRRFHERGRMLPNGLRYVYVGSKTTSIAAFSSWNAMIRDCLRREAQWKDPAH